MATFTRQNVKYQTVDTRTIKGLKKAERLKRNGWTVGSVGLWVIEFYKPIEKKSKK